MCTISAFISVFFLSLTFLFSAVLVTNAAHAQTRIATKIASSTDLAANITFPVVQGKTNDGKAFKLSNLKGKVVLVMFWSTDCAICRDKMPELRENYKGWVGKPFELVLISVDRRMKDVDDYEAIINRMVPMQLRFVQLWTGEASY